VAEYNERNLDDLTEEPSQQRLEELKQKGQSAQSRELSGTMALIGVMLAVYFLSSRFVTEITGLMKEIFSHDLAQRIDVLDYTSFTEILGRCSKLLFLSVAPVVLGGLVLGVLTSLAQVGFIVTTETLNPDFDRVNPISGFMRVFSLKSLTEGFKSLVKIVVVSVIVYSAIRAQAAFLPNVVNLGIGQLIGFIGQTTSRIFGSVILLLLATAAFDYWLQWRRFRRSAMMTKSEAKQELKEREGDPQIKARIRAIQRDVARKRMMKAVPKADVVVTNPTHIAVAIIYDPDEGFAPKVIAKGADYLAERIKKVAREHGIPTVENKPLARTLYKHVKVGQMIPRSLYQAVAEILAYVYKLKGKRLKSTNPQGPRGPRVGG
jgi:flagellar biosynthetic protein FlhB